MRGAEVRNFSAVSLHPLLSRGQKGQADRREADRETQRRRRKGEDPKTTGEGTFTDRIHRRGVYTPQASEGGV